MDLPRDEYKVEQIRGVGEIIYRRIGNSKVKVIGVVDKGEEDFRNHIEYYKLYFLSSKDEKKRKKVINYFEKKQRVPQTNISFLQNIEDIYSLE